MDQDGCITLVDYQTWLTSCRQTTGRDFTLPAPPGIAGFIAVLLGQDADSSRVAATDCNGNHDVDGRDIQLLVELLMRGWRRPREPGPPLAGWVLIRL